jgi:hypothetical protein
VVLTIANQRLLIGESFLDESMKLISDMAKVHDSPEVLSYAKKLGPASVRALYRWAYDHAESGLGVDIEWRRKEVIRGRVFAQRPEFEKLHQTISLTSDEQVSEFTTLATLVGANVSRQTFEMKLDTGEEIRGSLSEAISEGQTIHLPKRYRALIRKTQAILYSTDEEKVSYHLLTLDLLE